MGRNPTAANATFFAVTMGRSFLSAQTKKGRSRKGNSFTLDGEHETEPGEGPPPVEEIDGCNDEHILQGLELPFVGSPPYGDGDAQ